MQDLTQNSYYNNEAVQRPSISIYDRRSSFIDILIVAIPFIAILFNQKIGPLTPLLVLFVTPFYMLMRWERLFGVLLNCWPLLLLPIFAIASVFWSDHPDKTMRYGILYLLTVLPAVFVGAGCDKSSLIKGVFIAFAIYMMLSIPFGRWVGWGGAGSGGRAFAGLLGSKNASGDVAALTILTSIATFFWALHKGKLVWLIAALVILPLGLFTLWASKATGALIATILSLPCLLLWIASRKLQKQARTAIFILALVLAAIAISTITLWMEPLFEAVLENSGKDAGLTGRDILWRKADDLIRERPIIGRGYNAFWVHNNPDAEYLWREMGIKSRSGFNFHNTPRDILVDIGVVGLGLFVIVVSVASLRLVLRTMISPDFAGIFCCTLLVFESPRIFFELIGFQNMHFGTLIVFVILAYGMRPKELAYTGKENNLYF